MSGVLHKALTPCVRLETFPKAVVEIYVLLLDSGGSDLAVAITAASVALADAGIHMSDLLPACRLSRQEGGQLLLDPSDAEQAREDGSVLLAMSPASLEVTQLEVTGAWSAAALRDALELGMGACGQLRQVMREVLEEDVAAQAAQAGQ